MAAAAKKPYINKFGDEWPNAYAFIGEAAVNIYSRSVTLVFYIFSSYAAYQAGKKHETKHYIFTDEIKIDPETGIDTGEKMFSVFAADIGITDIETNKIGYACLQTLQEFTDQWEVSSG